MSRNVFVSYATRDRASVEEVLNQLRTRRVLSADDNVFVDHASFLAGDSFRDATRTAIEAADAVLVIWSDAAVNSKWVNYELAMAEALGKQLLVVSPKGRAAALPIDSRSVERLEVVGT